MAVMALPHDGGDGHRLPAQRVAVRLPWLFRRPRTCAALGSVFLHLTVAGFLLWSVAVESPVVAPAQSVRVRISPHPPAMPPQPVALRESDEPVPDGVANAGQPAVSAKPAPRLPPSVVEAQVVVQAASQAQQGDAELAVESSPDMTAVEGRTAPLGAQSASPPSASLPPSPTPAGSADPDWAGDVLARLEKFRVYPQSARLRREQGVALVRVRLDRKGRVLALELVASSGHAMLDAEALATFRRAQPLPPPPASMPDPVQLDVPVEFFIR